MTNKQLNKRVDALRGRLTQLAYAEKALHQGNEFESALQELRYLSAIINSDIEKLKIFEIPYAPKEGKGPVQMLSPFGYTAMLMAQEDYVMDIVASFGYPAPPTGHKDEAEYLRMKAYMTERKDEFLGQDDTERAKSAITSIEDMLNEFDVQGFVFNMSRQELEAIGIDAIDKPATQKGVELSDSELANEARLRSIEADILVNGLGYAKPNGPFDLHHEFKHSCEWEYCIENMPLTDPPTAISCPEYGHDCPGRLAEQLLSSNTPQLDDELDKNRYR